MRKLVVFAAGLLTTPILGALSAWVYFGQGRFDIAATAPVSEGEERAAVFVRERSLARRAPKGSNPGPVNEETLAEGLVHYRANCLACHGAPGLPQPAIGQGLNPPAPNLALADTQGRTDGALFWITSHGFRMTGMPGFASTHEPEDVWKMVSFVRHLPKITDAERERLRAGLPRDDEEPPAHAPAGAGGVK
ncbi:MAG: c-type cytochrome [Acidobacteria bacterium]|nr:c-type cytochrome [Acidobacteriota bacterium]